MSVFVILQMFEKHAAQPLYDGADHLAVQRGRIDDAADVFHRDVVEDVDVTGTWVDSDMGGMRAIAVGVFFVMKSALDRKPARPAKAINSPAHEATPSCNSTLSGLQPDGPRPLT